MYDYFIVIFIFALGAGVGGNLSVFFKEKSIWVSALLLLVCFLVLDKYKVIYRKKQGFQNVD